MRFGLIEENETAEFFSVLTGIWHVVREMTFWSKAVPMSFLHSSAWSSVLPIATSSC